MKTIAFLNVKGGVGKTTSTINFAYILSHMYQKRVLVIDLDKQANTTRAFGSFDMKGLSVSDLLTDKTVNVSKVIKPTSYKGIDIIPANMKLMKANQDVLLDVTRPQQTRLRKHLEAVKDKYDFCVIDCPTDVNMATINALVVTDDVLVPIKIDKYAFDGMEYVISAIDDMQEFNPKLTLRGCFVTMYQNNNVNRQGVGVLDSGLGLKFMNTTIRQTVKVQESTYIKPLLEYAPNCTASKDYIALVNEYLSERK